MGYQLLLMRFLFCASKIFCLTFFIFTISSCALLLLNGHLSHGYYVSPSESFKCKLPGGAFSTQLKISDRSNSIGETVTFKLDTGLLWRVDHLHLDHHKLANLSGLKNRREQLEQAKLNYIKYHLETNVDIVEINWEQYKRVNEIEVLIANMYIQWDASEETRELLFSIDDNYLNVLHYAQNISSVSQNITSGSLGLYKSCEF